VANSGIASVVLLFLALPAELISCAAQYGRILRRTSLNRLATTVKTSIDLETSAEMSATTVAMQLSSHGHLEGTGWFH
jgi:hypothetical protein